MIAEITEAKSVSIVEAKRNLSALLKEARKEPVVITRRNEPDSVILPYEEYVKLRRIRAYHNIVQLSKRTKASGVSLQEILDESRRELEERGS
jgi:prevent-host-death family protein